LIPFRIQILLDEGKKLVISYWYISAVGAGVLFFVPSKVIFVKEFQEVKFKTTKLGRIRIRFHDEKSFLYPEYNTDLTGSGSALLPVLLRMFLNLL
jgi:hypothetical protein